MLKNYKKNSYPITLGVDGVVGGVLVADAPIVGHLKRSKGAKFHRKPHFVHFRTKSIVHSVRTKSLSEILHNFEIFGKTLYGHFAQW